MAEPKSAHAPHAGKYVLVYVGLLVLTTLTLLLSFQSHGATSVGTSYAIATAKAALVAWFFMHLDKESWSARLALIIGVLLAILLAGLVYGDVSERPKIAIETPALK